MMSRRSRQRSDRQKASPPTRRPSGVRGDGVNRLIIDSPVAEIERVRADDDFTARAKKLLERDQAILDRLAK